MKTSSFIAVMMIPVFAMILIDSRGHNPKPESVVFIIFVLAVILGVILWDRRSTTKPPSL